MSNGIASSDSCLAIILGASEWPKVDGLTKSTTFRNSASAFAHYLLRPSGLELPYTQVLDLFDSDSPNTGQLEAIENFLRSHLGNVDDTKRLRNLLVYYVGHGAFVGPSRDYILAIRSTRSTDNAASSIRMSDLASILLTEARQLRRFLILDCCFAAAAFTDFQSGVSAAVSAQTLDSFPPKGTSLLCAASRRSVALSDDRQGRTMFSGALVDVLTNGVPELDDHLSLTEIGDATWHRLQSTFHEKAVRPEVHSPDRREGAVADVPLFPNPARQPRPATEAASELGLRLAEDGTEENRLVNEAAEEQRLARQAEEQRLAHEAKRNELAKEVASKGRLDKEAADEDRPVNEAAENQHRVAVYPLDRELYLRGGLIALLFGAAICAFAYNGLKAHSSPMPSSAPSVQTSPTASGTATIPSAAPSVQSFPPVSPTATLIPRKLPKKE